MRALTSNEMEFLAEASEEALKLVISNPYYTAEDNCDYLTEEAEAIFNKIYDEIEHSYITLIVLG